MITSLFIQVAVLIVILQSAFFLLALLIKRNDLADLGWGLLFIIVALFLLFCFSGGMKAKVVVGLTSIWGLRLFLHISWRLKNTTEDFRYRNWRTEWGKTFYWRTFFQVFLLQGFFAWLICFSIMVGFSYSHTYWRWINGVGLLAWGVGFFFETVGDYQLMNFKKNPSHKGLIITSGLWKYTRHPNYFGEVLQWWGIFGIILQDSFSLVAAVSPLTVTWLLLKVSGIPLLEKKYENHPEFLAYKKKTSSFFPWFPKR